MSVIMSVNWEFSEFWVTVNSGNTMKAKVSKWVHHHGLQIGIELQAIAVIQPYRPSVHPFFFFGI